MKSLLPVAIFFGAFNAIQFGEGTVRQICPPNEEYTRCRSECNTCADRDNCKSTTKCAPGCQCVAGFFRNRNWQCVPAALCDDPGLAPCRSDEVFLECGCVKSCCNKDIAESCASQCLKGCFCRDGLVRDKRGKCVKPEDCPDECPDKKCGINEQYYENKPDCKNTCENYDDPGTLCLIGSPGCFCKEGLVKRKDGKCVPPEECYKGIQCDIPKCGPGCKLNYDTKPCPSCDCYGNPPADTTPGPGRCGLNEQYYRCRPCRNTCDTYDKPVSCAAVCIEGCDCKKDLVRRRDGKCVKPSQCSAVPVCGINEEYSTCGTYCEPTCQRRNPICITLCKVGCFCKKGYIRFNGQCVPEDLCPPVRPCPLIYCPPNCYFDGYNKPCPRCVCDKNPKDRPCPLIKCAPGCYLDRTNKPCPRCVCDRNPGGIQCGVPDCGPGCKINYDTKPCPSCDCDEFPTDRPCPLIKCAPGCYLDRTNKPCPRCVCDRNPGGIQCGIPKCGPGCKLNYDTKPCPSCDCDEFPPGIQCSIPECGPGCQLNYDTKPCPSCDCDEFPPGVQCDIPKCDLGCKINYDTKPCPSCDCNENPPGIQCSIPECGPGCKLNYDTKPCPSCDCDEFPPGIQCDIPKCDPGCKINYDTKPCPSCDCNENPPEIQCGMPKCGPGCKINYNTKPCPSCDCGESRPEIKCGLPKCGPGCKINYDTKPCPSCDCDEFPPGIQCDIPKCDLGCKLNYDTKPCPSCDCNENPPNTTDRPILCGPDEQHYDCIPSCRGTCETYNKKVLCSYICRPGCYCKQGLVKRKDGKCVAPEECSNVPDTTPKPRQCGPGEQYYGCKPCRPYCETYNEPVFCVAACIPGCDCKEGLVKRKRDGKCVKPGNCPTVPGICGPFEEYSDCVDACNDCASKNVTCNFLVCNKGCDCIPGYTRYQGRCIPESSCPPNNEAICGIQEEYKECGTSCEPSCAERNPICIQVCKSGCFCKKGYIRSADGTCILEDQCPPERPCPRIACREGCYFDNSKPCPKCVCPPKTCGKNEKFSKCGPYCEPSCANRNPVCIKVCQEGCFCKKGYVRSASRECIPEDQCPKVRPCPLIRCGEDCYFQNSKPCGKCICPGNRSCPQIRCRSGCYLDETAKPCPKCVCTNTSTIQCNIPRCRPGCRLNFNTKPCPSCQCNTRNPCPLLRCAPGCYLDSTHKPCPKCVCNKGPEGKCGPFEKYTTCAIPCNNCEIRGRCLFLVCNKGCDCIRGYFRNSQGKCIPASQCPKKSQCTKVGEVYKDCGSPCEATCASRWSRIGIRCPQKCRPGCFCRDGLVRDSNRNCVDPKDCDNGMLCPLPMCAAPCKMNYDSKPCPTCDCKESKDSPTNDDTDSYDYDDDDEEDYDDVNEEEDYEDVTEEDSSNDYEEEEDEEEEEEVDYEDKSRGPPCPQIRCRSGCRLDESAKPCPKCVCNNTPESSNQCNKRTEVFKTCGTACQPTCDNRNPRCTKQCAVGCFCKDGFIRSRKDGPCIPVQNCPAGKCNRITEVYKTCGTACQPTCDNRNPFCTKQCAKGCFCKDGYIRSQKEGPCIPKNTCPGDICREDEDYNSCGSACPATCEDPNPEICTRQCVAGCFCKNGTVRANNGSCIPLNQCPKKCLKNEVYSTCGTACAPTCSNLKPKCGRKCVRGCFCKKGFVKGPDGSCILRNSCPKGVCDIHEEFKTCGSACQATCENPSPICTDQCVEGCFCKKGYIRDSNRGRCISKRMCEYYKDKCKENEEYKTCGSACPPSCKNQEPGVCTLQCVEGCFCKEGLVRADNGTCVPRDQCPNVCKANEEYKTCGSACPATCKNPNPRACTRECVRGCFCKAGLVRAENGDCVPRNQCPSTDVCKANEEFKTCGSACPRTCKNPNPRFCTKQCVIGCFCKAGLVRADNGDCVPRNQCPKTDVCKANEEYKTCGSACPPTCKNPNPRFCTLQCVSGCFCKTGLLRADNGTCVPRNQCPKNPEKCGKDEQYYECIPSCTGYCETYNMSLTCKMACRPGCFCKPGLLKSKDGKCVPLEECSKTDNENPEKCGKDEQYYECIPSCKGSCETYNMNIACKMPCRQGCFCKPGLVKRKDGKCVSPEKCSTPDYECGPDEAYYNCKPDCANQCDPPKVCPVICKEGCFCKRGLVKRKDGKCVKKEQCNATNPSGCGEDEQYYRCKPNCKHTCETYDKKGGICPRSCMAGCFCKRGLVKRKDGKCVKPSECYNDGPHCFLPYCAAPCKFNYNSKPCPTCDCKVDECPLVNCLQGCRLDKDHKPCPTCVCDGDEESSETSVVQEDSDDEDTDEIDLEDSSDDASNDASESGEVSSSSSSTTYSRSKREYLESSEEYIVGEDSVSEEEEEEETQVDSVTEEESSEAGEIQCGKDEEYYPDGVPSCKNNCKSYFEPGIRCRLGKPGCFCKEGYVLREADGKCVLPEKCKEAEKVHVKRD